MVCRADGQPVRLRSKVLIISCLWHPHEKLADPDHSDNVAAEVRYVPQRSLQTRPTKEPGRSCSAALWGCRGRAQPIVLHSSCLLTRICGGIPVRVVHRACGISISAAPWCPCAFSGLCLVAIPNRGSEPGRAKSLFLSIIPPACAAPLRTGLFSRFSPTDLSEDPRARESSAVPNLCPMVAVGSADVLCET